MSTFIIRIQFLQILPHLMLKLSVSKQLEEEIVCLFPDYARLLTAGCWLGERNMEIISLRHAQHLEELSGLVDS